MPTIKEAQLDLNNREYAFFELLYFWRSSKFTPSYGKR